MLSILSIPSGFNSFFQLSLGVDSPTTQICQGKLIYVCITVLRMVSGRNVTGSEALSRLRLVKVLDSWG